VKLQSLLDLLDRERGETERSIYLILNLDASKSSLCSNFTFVVCNDAFRINGLIQQLLRETLARGRRKCSRTSNIDER